ncbi:MAG TPA: hypothetical protein ACHBX6_09450 [Arsenophonus nasoniae]|uniref:hypothetical protein n=1 Tax=Arsenophonus nasoniae TaxID=638 RepID=UPI003879B3C9
MHNYNDQFKSNPLQFIANNTINNIIWFQRAVSSAGTYEQKQWIEMCDTNKKASFDLQVHNKQQNTFELALSNPLSNNGSAIDAYWCPFNQGTEYCGFVDVPRINPIHNFIFTPAMNGCSLDIANSPINKDFIRIFHNQHPNNKKINDFILANTDDDKLIHTFNFAQYGTPNHPNAFNFMFYSHSHWYVISQPQQIDMLTLNVTFRPNSTFICQPVT